MKLLYISASLPFGPGEAFFFPELSELVKQGHDVTVVPVFGRGAIIHMEASGFPYLEPRLLSWSIVFTALVQACRSPVKTLRTAAWLLRSRNWRTMACNFVALPKALWLAEVVRRMHVDHMHACWATVAATVAMVTSELSGIPWSFTAHRWDILEDNLLRDKARRARFGRFISHASIQMSGLESTERLRVLHLGIEPPRLEAMENQKTPLVALSAGNLLPVKGHRYLLQAMWMLRQQNIGLGLLIAGDGELRSSLENIALDLGIGEQIRFLGQLRHEELLQLYAQGRVCMAVLPSVDLGNGTHEGIPVSLIEAMSFAIPVIGTIAGGTQELLDGGAGLLVPAADARALADAMALLTVSDELRLRIGAAGRQRVEEQFNVRTIVNELLRLMQVSHSY